MKLLFTAIAVICVITILWLGMTKLSRQKDNTTDTAIPTTTAQLRNIEEQILTTGEVRSKHQTPVKSEISGRIAKLHVEVGQTVESGENLLELDRSELLSQKEEFSREVTDATLRHQQAGRNFKRLKEMFSKEFVTEKEYMDAETEEQLALNQVELKKARVNTLDEKLVKTNIKSPQAGVIVECNVKEGEVIVGADSMAPGTILMEVADLNSLAVKIEMNEVEVAQLRKDAPAKITFDAIPGISVTGMVTSIAPVAKQDTEKKLRVFPVEVEFTTDETRIRPGITANVTFPVAQTTQAVAVLISAVFSDGTNRVVFIQEKTDAKREKKQPRSFEKVSVTTGLHDDQYVEIKTGLQAGDIVALDRPERRPATDTTPQTQPQPAQTNDQATPPD